LGKAIRQSLQMIAPRTGDRVVDLGCGDRPYQGLIRDYGCEYLPCDIDGPPDVIRIEPGRPLPFANGSCQGVVSFQVLEHVWDLDAYLGEAHRLLCPDGWLLLSTHGSWPYHPHPTDFRRWTRAGLIRELETRGFAILNVLPIVGLLALTSQYRLLAVRNVLQRIPLLSSIMLPVVATVMNARMGLEELVTPKAVREDNACAYVVLARRPLK
jgi:SAM-dependent methyltransferase